MYVCICMYVCMYVCVGLVVVAERHVAGEDGEVLPRGRMPVRVVVALLRALEAVAVAVGVLARRPGVVVVQVLVGRVEALVARAALAFVRVVRGAFVDPVLNVVRVSLVDAV